MNKPQSVRRPGLLILGVMVLQCALLGVGGVVAFRFVRHDLASEAGRQVAAENAALATELGTMIGQLDAADMAYGSAQWSKLQEIVETTKLPTGGYVCILDESGGMLCHPRIREEPSLRAARFGAQAIITTDGRQAVLGQRSEGVLAGRAYFLDDGYHYVAEKFLPNIGGHLIIDQPESQLVGLTETLASPAMLVVCGSSGLVLLFTLLACNFIARRGSKVVATKPPRIEQEVARQTRENVATRDALIFGLAKLADFRDSDSGTHLERVREYCELLAVKLAESNPEINTAFIENLRVAAALHDIGKVGIPDDVLLKSGWLTPADRKVMERHPVIGADMLIAVRSNFGDDPLVNMSIQVALCHHERWDGNGYPCGMMKEEIPLAARIVAIADVYDALTSSRPYKHALQHDEAYRIIVAARGSHFDPAVVEAFQHVHEHFSAARASLQVDPRKPVRRTPLERIAASAGSRP